MEFSEIFEATNNAHKDCMETDGFSLSKTNEADLSEKKNESKVNEANSSYCRFENTRSDLRDCANHLHDNLSTDEADERERLIKLCQKITTDWAAQSEQRKTKAALSTDNDKDKEKA